MRSHDEELAMTPDPATPQEQPVPNKPGWYECRFLRNPPDWLIVRWWSGRALYHTRRESDAVDLREYTDFIGPLVPITEQPVPAASERQRELEPLTDAERA